MKGDSGAMPAEAEPEKNLFDNAVREK